MAQEPEKKMQDGQENEFHLNSYRLGNGPLWRRKGEAVISQSYQINETMVKEEEFDFIKLQKNTYHHNVQNGQSVVYSEHVDDPVGGQLTSSKAREALAVFDRIDSQIAIGVKMSGKSIGKEAPNFQLIAEDGYGFSIWMPGKENEVNRVRQINPEVAVIESYDMKAGTKQGTLYEVATGRTKPASEQELGQIFADTSSPTVGMPRVKEIYAALMARQPIPEPVAAKPEVVQPIAAAREQQARFGHPKDDLPPKAPQIHKKPQGPKR